MYVHVIAIQTLLEVSGTRMKLKVASGTADGTDVDHSLHLYSVTASRHDNTVTESGRAMTIKDTVGRRRCRSIPVTITWSFRRRK